MCVCFVRNVTVFFFWHEVKLLEDLLRSHICCTDVTTLAFHVIKCVYDKRCKVPVHSFPHLGNRGEDF